jgi:hypothetical protein
MEKKSESEKKECPARDPPYSGLTCEGTWFGAKMCYFCGQEMI